MKEVEHEEEMSKSLIDEYMDDDEDFDNNQEMEKDDFNDKSCVTKCCFYLWCCCCCHSTEKSKKSYQKGWRSYLIKEGVDSSDQPFLILTNLFTNKDGSIAALESIRLNPNLVSANKLRNDLEFYIPQLCTFLLFGEMKAIEEFFVFLCKVCNASFFFAHRVHWFLSAMINAAQEKRDDIIGILKMINTLFKSENEKRKSKLNKFYLANSAPFMKFIKSHNLSLFFLISSFIIDNTLLIFFNRIFVELTDESFIIFSTCILVASIVSITSLLDNIISSILSVFNLIFSPHLGQISSSFSLLYTNIFIPFLFISNK